MLHMLIIDAVITEDQAIAIRSQHGHFRIFLADDLICLAYAFESGHGTGIDAALVKDIFAADERGDIFFVCHKGNAVILSVDSSVIKEFAADVLYALTILIKQAVNGHQFALTGHGSGIPEDGDKIHLLISGHLEADLLFVICQIVEFNVDFNADLIAGDIIQSFFYHSLIGCLAK